MPTAIYLVAVETVHVATTSGLVRTVHAGTTVAADDPAVQASPSSFRSPAEVAAAQVSPVHTAVEQATAAPGELRAVRRAPKEG